MRIISRSFVEGKPAAREITLGYTTMWFAGEYLIGYKYLGLIGRNNPGTGYAGQISEHIPNGSSYRLSEIISKYHPVYAMPQYGFLPRIVMYAGRSANAHMVLLGNATLYFSYHKLIGFTAFDKMYIIDTSDSTTMSKHIASMVTDRTGYETVNSNQLQEVVSRYFGQYERGISCAPNI